MNKMVSKTLLLVAIATTTSFLTGCGPSFVRKDLGADVSKATKYGVLLTNIRYNEYPLAADPRFVFVGLMQQVASDELKKSIAGSQPVQVVLIPEQGEFDPLVRKIKALAPPPHSQFDKRKELDPANDYGDMKELFKKNDIDVLLVLESTSVFQKVPMSKLMIKVAADTALSAFAGSAMGGGISPATIMKMLAIGPDGKVIYSDWKSYAGGIFAKKGLISNEDSARTMAVTMIDRYCDNVVQR